MRNILVPVILGPTAGMKTSFSLWLAQTLGNVEIVSADSVQLYKQLDIGSAKPTPQELSVCPHHLVGVFDPTARVSAVDWYREAISAMDGVVDRGNSPVVVGGSEFYVSTLWSPFETASVPVNRQARNSLVGKRPEELHKWLLKHHPELVRNINPNDHQKLRRAWEVAHHVDRDPVPSSVPEPKNAFKFVAVGLQHEGGHGSVLNQRINSRVKKMVEDGFVGEAFGLWKNNRLGETARVAIGYRHLADCFDRTLGVPNSSSQLADVPASKVDDALEQIKVDTRKLAKRQSKWFRKLQWKAESGKLPMVDSLISIPMGGDWWDTDDVEQVNRAWEEKVGRLVQHLETRAALQE